eukprot:964686-Pyramimonas_sp.AAC.1
MALLVRFTQNGKSTIRLAEVFELMRLVGWPDSEWAVSDEVMVEGQIDTISNMCGNAFSFWHYGPWWAAMVSTCGMYAAAYDDDAEMEDARDAADFDDDGLLGQ